MLLGHRIAAIQRADMELSCLAKGWPSEHDFMWRTDSLRVVTRLDSALRL